MTADAPTPAPELDRELAVELAYLVRHKDSDGLGSATDASRSRVRMRLLRLKLVYRNMSRRLGTRGCGGSTYWRVTQRGFEVYAALAATKPDQRSTKAARVETLAAELSEKQRRFICARSRGVLPEIGGASRWSMIRRLRKLGLLEDLDLSELGRDVADALQGTVTP